MKAAWLVLLVPLAGCLDSLVSDPCQPGFELHDDQCVVVGDGGGSDPGSASGSGSGSAGSYEQDQTCTADVASDPDNCGHCGRQCDSGLCEMGVCVGDISGHIVTIGHDFAQHDPAMQRVLANAIALGAPSTIRIGWYAGTASHAAASGALASAQAGLQQLSLSSIDTPLAGDIKDETLAALDALVIDAQTGDATAAFATGARWSAPLAHFLAAGHVVILLEGGDGVTHEIARGAGLYSVTAPTDVTGQQATVINAADAVALMIPTPYLARASSVSFANAPGAVIAAPTGDAIVFHTTY